jgi:nucleotide-binding universal stress UspA family protein
MTFVVPYDGSDLAKAALVRATEFSTVFETRVLAVSVVPENNATYAREHGWLGPDEEFDVDAVVSTLHEQVVTLSPSANFQHDLVDRYASAGRIAKEVRKVAQAVDAAMVFIGSDDAGKIVSSVGSVGSTIATDETYDVIIVRDPSPEKIRRIEDAPTAEKRNADFYVPE